jgi:hypothetical protein
MPKDKKEKSKRSKRHAKKVEKRHSSRKIMINDIKNQLSSNLAHHKSSSNPFHYKRSMSEFDGLFDDVDGIMASHLPSFRPTAATSPILSRRPSTDPILSRYSSSVVSDSPVLSRKPSSDYALSPWANGESPSALSSDFFPSPLSSPPWSRRSSYQP